MEDYTIKKTLLGIIYCLTLQIWNSIMSILIFNNPKLNTHFICLWNSSSDLRGVAILIFDYRVSLLLLSLCRAIGTDIPDPFSPPLPIVHHFRQVLRATLRIVTVLLYVDSSWSPCFRTAMWRSPQEYITDELVPTSPTVSCMSGSSNLDSFRDGW